MTQASSPSSALERTMEVYSQLANPAFEAELGERTAARDAAFLMPHLRSGMRLIDVGCGPGSITLGLAEIVGSGEVVGIDIQPAQVAQARRLAADRRTTNVRFEAGNFYALPFPDRSFDAAFTNGVLMHLAEPVRALTELRRVLRPGGVAAVRDPDFGTAVYAPMTPLLEHWLAVRAQARLHNGGDPSRARHYRRLLLDAGFARAEAGASVESAGSHEKTERHAVFLKAMLEGLARVVLAQGWMDRAAIDETLAEIEAWARRPDAFYATTWCEALGWASG